MKIGGCYNKAKWDRSACKARLLAQMYRMGGILALNNMAEILIVNGLGIFLMAFLRLTRIENAEKRLDGERYFDIMLWLTIAGCFIEALTFVIDGKMFPFCRAMSYVLNSFLFIATCSVGFLWCLYVDFRLYNSIRRVRSRARWLAIPLAVDIAMNIINLSGCGIVFTISEGNVYARGSLVAASYVILFFYFIYSICLVDFSKRNGLHIRFFPVYYFVLPVMVGTLVQGFAYGITMGWACVAIALLFIYIQTQSLNIYIDSLSGLYNRRYLDCIIGLQKNNPKFEIYGIMIDVNDFKRINDLYGHSQGDDAIRNIGRILSDAIPSSGLAVRYAGDEFVVLLRTDEEAAAQTVIAQIKENVDQFNREGQAPYTMSLAMGCSRFDTSSGDAEKFFSAMDEQMYAAKRAHYQQDGKDRRSR